MSTETTAVTPEDRHTQARLKRLEEMKSNPEDARHGTMTGVQIGCDCENCLARNRQRSKEWYDNVNRKVQGDPKVANTPWSDEDVNYLKSTMDAPAVDVAKHLGRSLNSVIQKRQHVKHNPNVEPGKRKRWSDEDVKFVEDHPDMTAAELAAKLERTIGSIRLLRNQIKKRKAAAQS